MSIALMTLNIEGDNHFDRWIPYCQDMRPDVLCLQEVFVSDMPMIQEKLGMQGRCIPTFTVPEKNEYRLAPKGAQGVALLTRTPSEVQHRYYVGSGEPLPNLLAVGPERVPRVLVWTNLQTEAGTYCIATTHFTWAPGGSVTDTQRDHLALLLQALTPLPDVVLCGDFNAPRGTEIFDTLASRYTDTIPASVTTTMDNALHRNPNLAPLVVDVLFTTPTYQATNVQVVSGLSDHCAIVATLSLAKY